MAETNAQRAQAVEVVMTATANQSASVIEAALNVIDSPSAKTRDILWLIFVGGLIVALLASVVGVLIAALDNHETTKTDDILKIFTPLLTGIVGLFVKSPREK